MKRRTNFDLNLLQELRNAIHRKIPQGLTIDRVVAVSEEVSKSEREVSERYAAYTSSLDRSTASWKTGFRKRFRVIRSTGRSWGPLAAGDSRPNFVTRL